MEKINDLETLKNILINKLSGQENNRNFDSLNYYDLTNIPLNELLNRFSNTIKLSSVERNILINFVGVEDNRNIDINNLESFKENKYKETIYMNGLEITKEIKDEVFNFLITKNYQISERTFNDALKRVLVWYLKIDNKEKMVNELLYNDENDFIFLDESVNVLGEDLVKNILKKLDDNDRKILCLHLGYYKGRRLTRVAKAEFLGYTAKQYNFIVKILIDTLKKRLYDVENIFREIKIFNEEIDERLVLNKNISIFDEKIGTSEELKSYVRTNWEYVFDLKIKYDLSYNDAMILVLVNEAYSDYYIAEALNLNIDYVILSKKRNLWILEDNNLISFKR